MLARRRDLPSLVPFNSEQFQQPPAGASSSHCDDAMIRRVRMTVAQLKTQMDRRFTRLERTLRSHVAETGTRFASVDTRFAAIDARFEAVDARFDAMDARFDSAERRADVRMGTLERRLDSVDDKLDAIIGILRDGLQHHQRILDEHETRLNDLERQSDA